jgi:hypothetical protein
MMVVNLSFQRSRRLLASSQAFACSTTQRTVPSPDPCGSPLSRMNGALREMKQKGELWRFARHRRGRWLNNRVEQDHRRIKRLTRPMLGFQGFWTAKRTLAGIEAMARLAKGQVRAVPRGDMPAQRTFVQQIFGLAA